MEVQLQELIEKIKQEGIKEAEEKAAALIKEAEIKAADIVTDANKKAEIIRLNAEKDAGKTKASGKEALRQAGRDLILNIQAKLENIFNEIVALDTAKSFSASVLEETIVALIKGWSDKKSGDITLLLSESDLKKVEKPLTGKLAQELKKGFELKASPNVEAGFRISEKNGSAYYNFSSQGIAELLSEYLNPILSEIIRESAEGA